MKCLTCKNIGSDKCPIYKNGGYIEHDCPKYEKYECIEVLSDNCQVHISKPHLCVSCLICGKPVELSEFESSQFVVKVCDKCKKAIMKVREELNNGL